MKNFLLILVLFSSCASIQTLDGGEKDKTPPTVLSVSPKNRSLFVKNKTIVYEFNEYIKSSKLNDLLIVSPSQKINPVFVIKNKKLYIRLQDSLLKNSTYSIKLNGGIVDNNEGNPLEMFDYVFSTGSYIDSLKYQGYVYSFLKKQPLENYNIQLYKKLKDSTIFKEKPDYITKSNDSGFFVLSNLPNEKLMVAVFEDKNKNLLYDKDEDIAMLKNIFTLENSQDTFYTFNNQNDEKYKLTLLKNDLYGVIKIKSNKTITQRNIVAKINQNETPYFLNKNRDTITLFNNNYKDSNNINISIDTLNFNFNVLKNTISIIPKININKTKSTNKKVVLNSNCPVILNTDSIKILNNNYKINQLNPTEIEIKFNVSIDSIKIIFKANALKTNYNEINKIDTLTYIYKEINNNLIIKIIKHDSINYLFELLNNDKIIQYKNGFNQNKIHFKNLKPGNYSLRVIDDINNNEIWDTGNIFKKIMPEKIKLFNNIEIRNNWDKELIINLL